MAKEFALDHEQDIKAYMLAPWRKKVEENRYASSCGCIFDAEGKGVKLCDDPWLYHELPACIDIGVPWRLLLRPRDWA